mgnify:FL=1
MKKIFLLPIILFFACGQPKQNESVETKKVDYIFKTTYIENCKIGNPKLVLKVQEMHKYIINKDY